MVCRRNSSRWLPTDSGACIHGTGESWFPPGLARMSRWQTGTQTTSPDAVLRMGIEIDLHAIRLLDGLGKERHSLVQPVVRLGTAEAQEPLPGRAEALAAQAGDP